MPQEALTTTKIDPKAAEKLIELFKSQEEFKAMMNDYRCAMMEIETKLKVLNENLSLSQKRNPIETIKCRLKSPKSILEKLWRKGLPLTIENIRNEVCDIAGVRVICAFPEDVYLLANYLLMQDDIRLIRAKDYIKKPKDSGYRSLHLIIGIPIFLPEEKREIKVEIQLRTIAMDFWASLEHKMKYKKDLPNAEEIAKELKKCAEKIAQLDQSMQAINNKIEKRD